MPAPGRESYADVAARVTAWLSGMDEIETTIAVCQGVMARVLRDLYAGFSHAGLMTLDKLQGKIFRLADGEIEEIAA